VNFPLSAAVRNASPAELDPSVSNTVRNAGALPSAAAAGFPGQAFIL